METQTVGEPWFNRCRKANHQRYADDLMLYVAGYDSALDNRIRAHRPSTQSIKGKNIDNWFRKSHYARGRCWRVNNIWAKVWWVILGTHFWKPAHFFVVKRWHRKLTDFVCLLFRFRVPPHVVTLEVIMVWNMSISLEPKCRTDARAKNLKNLQTQIGI